jgi:hypothetical protein
MSLSDSIVSVLVIAASPIVRLTRSATATDEAQPLAMSLRRSVIGLAVLVVLVLAIAWIDGGEESLHEISQPVAVPEGKL